MKIIDLQTLPANSKLFDVIDDSWYVVATGDVTEPKIIKKIGKQYYVLTFRLSQYGAPAYDTLAAAVMGCGSVGRKVSAFTDYGEAMYWLTTLANI